MNKVVKIYAWSFHITSVYYHVLTKASFNLRLVIDWIKTIWNLLRKNFKKRIVRSFFILNTYIYKSFVAFKNGFSFLRYVSLTLLYYSWLNCTYEVEYIGSLLALRIVFIIKWNQSDISTRAVTYIESEISSLRQNNQSWRKKGDDFMVWSGDGKGQFHVVQTAKLD